ncbi:MAG TPA: hypothetical protein VMX55_05970 [candidate division Zixibacteria bacterium]|nr:hypothetical protein [candidate division Zixibacteria bacterium]
MKRFDLDIFDLIKLQNNQMTNSFHDVNFEDSLINDESSKGTQRVKFWCKIKSFFNRLWQTPESRVVILLLLSRIFFIIFTHYGMDFDFYIDIVKRVLTGERLYVDIQSTHMPLVDLLYITMYVICPWKENIYALRIFMKFPFVLCDIGITIAIMKIIENEYIRTNETGNVFTEEQTKKIDRTKLGMGYLIAFSLPLIVQTAGGRYDSLMIFCFTMAILCLQKNNWFGVAFFAALGSSAKYIGIIFLPFVIFWMKKDDFLPFVLGLLLGFLPIFPFLFTIPTEFINAIFLRGSHIAYGFSIWHAVFIIWNGFNMKYVDGIESTYDCSGEPMFIQKSYIPMFLIIYLTIFVWFLLKNSNMIRTQSLSSLPLQKLVLLVFIPLFIFALSFKAINIQVLAWFVPYIALRRKKGLFFEYTILTLVHGFALIIFEAYNPATFLELSQLAASTDSPLYHLIVKPALVITQGVPQVVWASIIFITILWFFIRTTIELITSSKELITNEYKQYSA